MAKRFELKSRKRLNHTLCFFSFKIDSNKMFHLLNCLYLSDLPYIKAIFFLNKSLKEYPLTILNLREGTITKYKHMYLWNTDAGLYLF